MNPFVNPKKRSISLPSGCKDLVDVLKRSESKHDSAIRRFIHLVLLQAQQDEATELVIGATPASGDTPIRYKFQETWYDLSPFPSHIRPDIVSELARMAKFPEGEFPNEGVLDMSFGDVQLRWIVGMTSAEGECMLVRAQD
jgi:type II secretory ATPase GspE/PulE/Tfp pilus assembly ATPase PilB-like protein